MNGRVFVKRFLAVTLLVFGFAALGGEGEAWAKALLLAACIVLALLLFRRTPKDDEWMRKREGGELIGQIMVPGMSEAKPRKQAARTGSWLRKATVLHVLAAPAIVLSDLLKMQK
jgi:Ca2+/Na+ antiporter